jgi:hypothetical protein
MDENRDLSKEDSRRNKAEWRNNPNDPGMNSILLVETRLSLDHRFPVENGVMRGQLDETATVMIVFSLSDNRQDTQLPEIKDQDPLEIFRDGSLIRLFSSPLLAQTLVKSHLSLSRYYRSHHSQKTLQNTHRH